jgi:Zn-dependent M32 family carboxypeptidase
VYPPQELLQRVTGSDLDPEPYLQYLQTKFA